MKAVLCAIAAILALFFCMSPIASAEAKTVSIFSTHTQVEIDAAVALLLPGDILEIHAGLYVGIALNLRNIKGTAEAWITIKGVKCGDEKPWIQANTDLGLHGITISAGVEFVAIVGLKISHLGVSLRAGIYIDANVHDILIDDCLLDSINGIGIDLLGRNNIANVVIKACVLLNIGKLAIAANLGVGIAVGGLAADVTGVVNIQLLGNVIHDVQGYEGSAIKVLLGVAGALIQDNVVWNCPRGFAPSTVVKAAIHVAVGANVLNVLDALAVVSGNIVLDSAAPGVALGAYVGLSIGAGTQCFNNLLLNVNVGIDLNLGGAVSLKNTLIAHNTVHGATSACFRGIANGLEDATLRIVNNLFSVGTDTTVKSIYWLNGNLLSNKVFCKQNFVTGLVTGTGNLVGQLLGAVLELLFGVVRLTLGIVSAIVNPILAIPGADFTPKGALLNVGVKLDLTLGLDLARALSLGLNLDLDLNIRIGLPDIGCYQHNSGAHWPLNYCRKNNTCSSASPSPCPAYPTPVPIPTPSPLPSAAPTPAPPQCRAREEQEEM